MTIFAKIIAGELPATKVYEDEHCIVIEDIHPRAPIHLLVIPRKPIVSLAHMDKADASLLGHLLWVVKTVAVEVGLGEHFQTKIHTGSRGGQEVFHLHIHVLGEKARNASDAESADERTS